MLIENKATQKRYNVSDKDWEQMQKDIIPGSENGEGKGKPFSSRYKIINRLSETEKDAMVPPELRRSTGSGATNEDFQADAEKKRNTGKSAGAAGATQ